MISLINQLLQVRLWGDKGQHSISEARVAVLGSSALAAETLKSLVLAGIGSYEIIDSETVQKSDFGNNFFVTKNDVGRNRGEAIVQNINVRSFSDCFCVCANAFLLQVINPNVHGTYRVHDFNKSPSLTFLDCFSLVIGANVRAELALKISDYLYARNVPFIWATTSGLIGYMRIVYREHHVLHDHQEMAPHDFRQVSPTLFKHKNIRMLVLQPQSAISSAARLCEPLQSR